MVGFFGHQHVDDLCRTLLVDARSDRLVAHYINHFLGA